MGEQVGGGGGTFQVRVGPVLTQHMRGWGGTFHRLCWGRVNTSNRYVVRVVCCVVLFSFCVTLCCVVLWECTDTRVAPTPVRHLYPLSGKICAKHRNYLQSLHGYTSGTAHARSTHSDGSINLP